MRVRLPLLALGFASGCLLGDSDNGQYLYQSQCQGCHGADGAGGLDVGGTWDTGTQTLVGTGTSADLRERVPQLTDERILRVLRDGQRAMPSQFAEDDDQALDVLSYLRDTFE